MPKTYLRKNNQYIIQMAINEYRTSPKPSCKKICQSYDIPEVTFRRYLKKEFKVIKDNTLNLFVHTLICQFIFLGL